MGRSWAGTKGTDVALVVVTTYRRAGFVEEGRAREAVFREGGWQDKVQMGILDREWRLGH